MTNKPAKATLMTETQLNEFFSRDDVKSLIISDFAMLDDLLGVILARYFVEKNREKDFVELLVDTMPFSRKLVILRKARYRRKYKSLEVIKFLENLSRIRNIAAHHYSWSIKDDELRRLQSNKEIMRLISNFPHTLDEEIDRAISRLARLQYTKDFTMKRNKNTNI